MRVLVYRNLNKRCLSVMACDGPRRGRVIAYAQFVEMKDCNFIVRRGGWLRAMREKRKNVHAFVRGTLKFVSKYPYECGRGTRVCYNPWISGSFRRGTGMPPRDGDSVSMASAVQINADGVIMAEGIA